MAHIPHSVLKNQPSLEGIKLRGMGKVRDSYELPDHPDKMLVVASDRCSIFDFVLPATVPLKGPILTALNHFWAKEVACQVCETDFIACGADIDGYLPEHLRRDAELQKRATVVQIFKAPDVEDIVRFILTGSGWKSYGETGVVCGHALPAGLTDGSKLPYPLYTPTTKAETGHDEHITADSVAERFGVRRERLALQVAGAIADFAAKRGIIMADTKFEFSQTDAGQLILVDEKGTPDSSRFFDKDAWEKSFRKGKSAPSLDKQFVRDWGIEAGINKRNPELPNDLAYVDQLEVPEAIIKMTTRIYRYIFWRLTGMQIEVYQHSKMGILTSSARKRRIEIVVGSESDLPQTQNGISSLIGVADVKVSVISCHRNPAILLDFVMEHLRRADIVIAGAGMAAALPGIIKSHLCATDQHEIPVIGVAFKSNSEEDNEAARLSIERLPGQPVELGANGKAYFGSEGFLEACLAAIGHEFLPRGMEIKPAQIHIKTGFESP